MKKQILQITLIFGIGILSSCTSEKNKTTIKKDVTATKVDTTIALPHTVGVVKIVKPAIDTIRGVDVSHFQGDVNWDDVKASGMHFGITKATQGLDFVDPKFSENWVNIGKSGLYRGTYHFYVAEDDPIKQAEHFVNTVKSIDGHHLPPALDLEGENIGGKTIEQYHKDVLAWLNHVESKLNVKPMIYTNNPFGNKYLDNEKFSEYVLWVAEYGINEAKIPISWQKSSWTGWQFTSHDTLKGINTSVDESKFLSSILLVD